MRHFSLGHNGKKRRVQRPSFWSKFTHSILCHSSPWARGCQSQESMGQFPLKLGCWSQQSIWVLCGPGSVDHFQQKWGWLRAWVVWNCTTVVRRKQLALNKTHGSSLIQSYLSTEISGPIPSQMGKLTSMDTLNLNNNQLSGFIPTELGALSSLDFLGLRQFGNNTIFGVVPTELCALPVRIEIDCEGARLVCSGDCNCRC